MNDNLKVNVILTSKDIKNFTSDKHLKKLFTKLIFSLVIIIAMIIPLLPLIEASLKQNDGQAVFLRISLSIIIIFVLAVNCLPILINYLFQKSKLKSNNQLNTLCCYEFIEEGMKILFSSGSLSISWAEINKIEESKHCFTIHTSPNKTFILPKRCFNNIEQLDIFKNLIADKIDNRNLKLKKYKVQNFSPDYVDTKAFESNVEENKSDTLPSLFEFRGILTKSELIKTNLRLYYTNPAGTIMTALGLFFIYSGAKSFINSSDYSLTYSSSINLFPFIFGFIFTIMMPFNIYRNTSKQFKKNSDVNNINIYRFYSDYFTVNHPKLNLRIAWNELSKIVNTKSSYIFFTTNKTLCVIPKRLFEDKQSELQILKDIISEKCPSLRNSL